MIKTESLQPQVKRFRVKKNQERRSAGHNQFYANINFFKVSINDQANIRPVIGRKLSTLYSHWLKPRLIHVSEMHFSNYFVVISGGFPDSGKQKLHANVEMWIVTQTKPQMQF